MPDYGATVETIFPGRPTVVWDSTASPPAETIAGNSRSAAVAFLREGAYQNFASATIEFTGDPGAFEVEFHVADIDEEKYYVKHSSVTVKNASNVAKLEVVFIAKFVTLFMKTLTNAVGVKATIA